MDTDFHYFGTYTAAVAAGFKEEDAAIIANAAEFVDYFDTTFWAHWKVVDEIKNGKPGKTLEEIKVPALSAQTLTAWGFKSWAYEPKVWGAWHFLPGNKTDTNEQHVKRLKDMGSTHRVRKLHATTKNECLLCRPYSKIVLEMIDHTHKYRKRILAGEKMGCFDLDTEDRRILSLIFLGMRMHTLADTWAHQDFAAVADKVLNGAGTRNYIYSSDEERDNGTDEWEFIDYSSSLLKESDVSGAFGWMPGDLACAGHGQVGHYPDYGWLKLLYPAGWLKDGSLLRDNPTQFKLAWRGLAAAMKECLDGPIGKPPPEIPVEYAEAISKPHVISKTGYSCVPESEKTWAAAAGKKGLKPPTRNEEKPGCTRADALKTRWGHPPASGYKYDSFPSHAEWAVILGARGDKENGKNTKGTVIPKTSGGEFWIEQKSLLHLFEFACWAHFRWCQRWAKDNPAYRWDMSDLTWGAGSHAPTQRPSDPNATTLLNLGK